MKKNKIMRLASALLVLTLMTTCAISSTFAKYTTSTTGTDKARVAYWGFKQGATTTIDLFDGTYNDATNGETVKAANDDNVIAPGTAKTSEFAFGYDVNDKASKPEVAYTFEVDATATGATTKLDADPSFTWTLQKKGDTNKQTFQKVSELTAAIEALSGDHSGSKEYKPGELPDAFTAADETYVVGWEWAFNGQDEKDTELGNDTTLENVNLTITITATQID